MNFKLIKKHSIKTLKTEHLHSIERVYERMDFGFTSMMTAKNEDSTSKTFDFYADCLSVKKLKVLEFLNTYGYKDILLIDDVLKIQKKLKDKGRGKGSLDEVFLVIISEAHYTKKPLLVLDYFAEERIPVLIHRLNKIFEEEGRKERIEFPICYASGWIAINLPPKNVILH